MLMVMLLRVVVRPVGRCAGGPGGPRLTGDCARAAGGGNGLGRPGVPGRSPAGEPPREGDGTGEGRCGDDRSPKERDGPAALLRSVTSRRGVALPSAAWWPTRPGARTARTAVRCPVRPVMRPCPYHRPVVQPDSLGSPGCAHGRITGRTGQRTAVRAVLAPG